MKNNYFLRWTQRLQFLLTIMAGLNLSDKTLRVSGTNNKEKFLFLIKETQFIKELLNLRIDFTRSIEQCFT